ncbi:MAG: hypothetical protein ABI628_07175 [Chloroflexota bacterium]
MTEDERHTEPTAAADTPDVPLTEEVDDAEGHSLGLILGMNALNHAREADARSSSKKVPEDELAPLSKKWPSLREHKKA